MESAETLRRRFVRWLCAMVALMAPCLGAAASDNVGTLPSSFNINAMGAAVWNMPIDVPEGGLNPHVGIEYNSQSGHGLLGYGFNISGITSITRGGKTLFSDGVQQGVRYAADDALFLCGVRLLPKSGAVGVDGSEYSPEGDPYTTVTVHGSVADASCWLEVRASDGMHYEYGRTADSRLTYTNGRGQTHTAAWYVSSAEDAHANRIEYEYACTNLTMRPTLIRYGLNGRRSRGILNTMHFNYEPLGDSPMPFAMEDRRGSIDVRLASVTSCTDGKTFRNYRFGYLTTGDGQYDKFVRLTNIYGSGTDGILLNPIVIDWDRIRQDEVSSDTLSVPTESTLPTITDQGRFFFAADVNGDGISDIMRISPARILAVSDQGYKEYEHNTLLYVNLSSREGSSVSYSKPYFYRLGPDINFSDVNDVKYIIGGLQAMDFDGDGFNDIIVPHFYLFDKQRTELFNIFYGNALSGFANRGSSLVSIPLSAATEPPLYTAADINGDGRDEVVCVEKQDSAGVYGSCIVEHNGGISIAKKRLHFSLPSAPESLFAADFNGDGISDIIMLCKDSYKIYFNVGGAVGTDRFSEASTCTGSIPGDRECAELGDFDGDGRADLVFRTKNSGIVLALSNGDGTFDIRENCASAADTQSDVAVESQEEEDAEGRGEEMAGAQGDDAVDAQQGDARASGKTERGLYVCDIDHDGRQDIICTSSQKTTGSPVSSSAWYLSNGTGFKRVKSQRLVLGQGFAPGEVFVGDFNGDGHAQIANCGVDLYTGDTANNDMIHVYSMNGLSASSGHVTKFGDGFGRKTSISYKFPTGSTPAQTTDYPVHAYALPLPVVGMVSEDGGAAGDMSTFYDYGGMNVHLTGKGMLGFSSVTSHNITLGTKNTERITAWDTRRWVPTERTTVATAGGDTATTVVTTTIADIDGNYFSHVSHRKETDFDGYQTETNIKYDFDKGVPTEMYTRYDGTDGMFRRTRWADYMLAGGRWQPTVTERSQKHADDNVAFTTRTVRTYDDSGDVVTEVANDGKSLPLTTTVTRDAYGNVLTSTVEGSGIAPNTVCREYDASGRFMVRISETASPEVHAYTYDTWGNMLSSTDGTEPSSPLTTRYGYDGWGRNSYTVDVYGDTATVQYEWVRNASGGGNADIRIDKSYAVTVSGKGRPMTKTWYDRAGHELEAYADGPKSVPTTRTTTYDVCGRVRSTELKIGRSNVDITESYTYDSRGRRRTATSSTGRTLAWTYGRRTEELDLEGRLYTMEMDAWGNIAVAASPTGVLEYTYSSCGSPTSIFSVADGTMTTIEYDDCGNRTALVTPDAGRTTYTYAADGRMTGTTDARGIHIANAYDAKGRLVERRTGDTVARYEYGSRGQLVHSECGGYVADYGYDGFGRMTHKSQTMPCGNARCTYTFAYHYDGDRLIASEYPDGTVALYRHDGSGYLEDMLCNGAHVYKADYYDGQLVSSLFCDRLSLQCGRDRNGMPYSRKLMQDGNAIAEVSTKYDPVTGNLMSRRLDGHDEQTFDYDIADRLLSSTMGGKQTGVLYDDNGNILHKIGVGEYTYADTAHPHAVTGVSNECASIPTTTLSTRFDSMGRTIDIADDGTGRRMVIGYGPDGQRWRSDIYDGDSLVESRAYLGDYEERAKGDSVTTYAWVGGGAMTVNGRPYYTFTDDQGSILSVVNGGSTKVFDASYDPWGVQTVTLDSIGMMRGYCGHEMLPEFGLINMNGRMYDPVLGRFLSPDNFVQLPWNDQNFNRYSYCLNNPLKYIDPSGQNFEILIFGMVSGAIMGGMSSAMSGGSFLKGVALGALGGAMSYGIGELFGGVGGIGHELLRAGAHGLAGGVTGAISGGGLVSGFASGFGSSLMGSFAMSSKLSPAALIAATSSMGGILSSITGGDFYSGAMNGLKIGTLNFAEHEITYTHDADGNITGTIDEVVVYANSTAQRNLEIAATFNTIGYGLTAVEGVNKYAGKCRVGSNGKVYLPKEKHAFYGNQYVKTQSINNIKGVGKAVKACSAFNDAYTLQALYIADGNQLGLNSQKYMMHVAGREIGSFVLGHTFEGLGGLAGNGVASVPLSIAGGIFGSYVGGEIGGSIADILFDTYVYCSDMFNPK